MVEPSPEISEEAAKSEEGNAVIREKNSARKKTAKKKAAKKKATSKKASKKRASTKKANKKKVAKKTAKKKAVRKKISVKRGLGGEPALASIAEDAAAGLPESGGMPKTADKPVVTKAKPEVKGTQNRVEEKAEEKPADVSKSRHISKTAEQKVKVKPETKKPAPVIKKQPQKPANKTTPAIQENRSPLDSGNGTGPIIKDDVTPEVVQSRDGQFSLFVLKSLVFWVFVAALGMYLYSLYVDNKDGLPEPGQAGHKTPAAPTVFKTPQQVQAGESSTASFAPVETGQGFKPSEQAGQMPADVPLRPLPSDQVELIIETFAPASAADNRL